MKFEYKNIVIGSDLRSMLYAYNNQYPIFYTQQNKPHVFDFLNTDNSNQDFMFKSFDKTYKFGKQKVEIWEKLFFLLSMQGLLPLANMCNTIRYDNEKLICSSEYSKLCEIYFDKCYYFGDQNTFKLVKLKEKENVRYKIYDNIAFTSGGKHNIDYFETSDNFVHKVWFYSSDRICGNTGVKDAYVLSILTDEQLSDPSHTETISRFKLMSHMKENGLKGKFNGYNKHGTPRFYNFKTHTISRSRVKIDHPSWSETSNVKKVNSSLEQLIKNFNNLQTKNYYLNGQSF